MTVTRNTSRDWAPHYSLGPALLTISVSWKTLTSLGISRPSGTLSLLAARLLLGVLWPAEQQSLQSTQCQAAGRGSQPPSLSWRPLEASVGGWTDLCPRCRWTPCTRASPQSRWVWGCGPRSVCWVCPVCPPPPPPASRRRC